jgi:hypothetical protein
MAGKIVVEDTLVEFGLDVLRHWKLPCVFTHSSPCVHFNWFPAHSFISMGQEKATDFKVGVIGS